MAEALDAVRRLLIDRPLYSKIESDDELMALIDNVIEAKLSLEFDLYCVACGVITPWVIKPYRAHNSGGGAGSRYDYQRPVAKMRIVHAVCMRKQHFYSYVLYRQDNVLQKIGQKPSMADIAHGELKSVPGINNADRKELGRALGLFAHDTPLGAFVYLRRVFERMIERAREHHKERTGSDIDGWRDLRMGDRIRALGDTLPQEISANSGVFGLLSKGIHELSDEDAETLFPLVKAVIFQMLSDEERHRQAIKARENTNKALKDAIAHHSSRAALDKPE